MNNPVLQTIYATSDLTKSATNLKQLSRVKAQGSYCYLQQMAEIW